MVSLVNASFALVVLRDTGDAVFPFCHSQPPGCLRLPLSSSPPGSGSSSVGEESVQLPTPRLSRALIGTPFTILSDGSLWK